MTREDVEMVVDIYAFFEGDMKKTYEWFEASNPGLGGMSPNDLISLGRKRTLLRFIDECLSENKR